MVKVTICEHTSRVTNMFGFQVGRRLGSPQVGRDTSHDVHVGAAQTSPFSQKQGASSREQPSVLVCVDAYIPVGTHSTAPFL